MSAKRCERCRGDRAHVVIGPDHVCWACYNQAVRESTDKVEARTMRRVY